MWFFFTKSIYECIGFYDDISKNVLVVPNYHFIWAACNAGDLGSIPELGRPLEKRTATHSRFLAWRIPWTEEPGRLQSVGWQRVRQDCDLHFNYQFNVKQLIFQVSTLRFPFLSFSVLSLHGCTDFLKLWQASTCYSLAAMYRLLITVASLVLEHRL